MELWTIQLSHWREAKSRSIALLDTTAKSGDEVFAPTWDLVNQFKNGDIDWVTYRRRYYGLMRRSYKEHKLHWKQTMKKPRLAVGCFCPPGEGPITECQCHRYLLVDIFEKTCKSLELPFEYKGELT